MPRKQTDSSLSIPVFDGSMMSLRTDSRSIGDKGSVIPRYKSALPEPKVDNK